MRRYTPRPYQLDGTEFACDVPRCNIFAPPGMGKTCMMLDFLVRRGVPSTLIVAPPLVVRETWAKEAQTWADFAHLDIVPIGAGTDARAAVGIAPPHLACINPDLIPWLFDQLDGVFPWDGVIFDESPRLRGYRPKSAKGQGDESKKGRSTLRSFKLSLIAHTQVDFWINLTGTPNANSYLDLWGPQWFVDAGAALGRTYGAYEQRWFKRENIHNPQSAIVLQEYAESQIQARIKPTTFTVRAEDYFHLTAPVHHQINVEMPASAWAAYHQMRLQLQAEFELGLITAYNAGVKAGKLRQIASGAVYHQDGETYSVCHEVRLDALESLVTELNGEPLVVVYRFKHELIQLRKRFPYLVEVRERDSVKRWNERKIRLLALHAASAGHGISLQHGGHHICFISPYSDNELYSQVIERLGPVRQAQSGYKRPVYVHHIMAPRTIDEQTVMVRERRVDELQGFLKAMSVS